ncbi:hypothetical protein ES703_04446 [subsurface metagenome]
MERAEKARKMLEAIEKKREEGEISEEDVYNILREKWVGILEGFGEAVEVEVPEEVLEKERLPPSTAVEDIEKFVSRLLKEARNLKQEIVVLQVEKESVQSTLKGLQGKLSTGALDKARFAKMTQEYNSRVKKIEEDILKKKGEIESIGQRFKKTKMDIEKNIASYQRALKKVEKIEI